MAWIVHRVEQRLQVFDQRIDAERGAPIVHCHDAVLSRGTAPGLPWRSSPPQRHPVGDVRLSIRHQPARAEDLA